MSPGSLEVIVCLIISVVIVAYWLVGVWTWKDKGK